MTTVHAATMQLSIPLTVSTETLVAAVAAGMIGGPYGYAYWCSEVKVRNHPDLSGERIAQRVLSGGSATFTETEGDNGEENVRHTLTRSKLLTGFGRWVVEFGVGGSHDAQSGVTDFEIDGPASDAIIQFAIFGEQKYC